MLIHSRFQHFRDFLSSYSEAKIAISGYEILFPKSLTIALESMGIRTVAAQERYIATFYGTQSFIMDTYFCASKYVAEHYAQAGRVLVRKYVPVGMLRTDILHRERAVPLMGDVAALVQGRKLIVALNFHSIPDETISKISPTINWQSNYIFIEDMLALAAEFPDTYILIRGKNIIWCDIPYFSDLMDKIEQTENISVDRHYDEYDVSYHLCAHANLVIAKHTSLGDECLAVGIPVLFHEYQHNAVGLVSHVFNQLGPNIMVRSYENLLHQTKLILKQTDSTKAQVWEPKFDQFYGSLNDANVKQRVMAELNLMALEQDARAREHVSHV